ncbi:hypothetical protein ON010_g10789 [Phytophthora cinnamomi]|nr:hypothetical protein ON010_g10789 [Phytophthora cinnamomi]
MYASPRYSRHHGGSSSYQTQTQHYTSPSKYSHAQYTSPSKYSGGYDGYSSPVKASAYQQQQHNYYSSPSSPTYYGQQEYYNSGASTASSSSQEGPFYADELDELDDYTMGIASPDMTTIPTVAHAREAQHLRDGQDSVRKSHGDARQPDRRVLLVRRQRAALAVYDGARVNAQAQRK